MKDFYPKVSIVIPVFNGANFLKQAIDSALVQTYKNSEIIVINDGSNDNGATEKIAKSYGNSIAYYKKENGGVATALNLGIEKMTGEYFSWLSHDDIYKSDKIEKQIDYLKKFKDKNVVLYSDYELMDEKGNVFEQRIQDHKMLGQKPIYSLLRGIVNGITILVPKSAFEKHGKFDASLWCTQDYDMWYRIFNDYKFVHQPDILSVTRIHGNQDTLANPRAVSEGNILWKRMINDLPDSTKISAEGSLFTFYFEMIKFLKHTPYAEVLEYCGNLLEEAAQAKEAIKEGLQNIDVALKTYDELLEERQKRASSYYFENLIKQLVDKGDTKKAASIMLEKLAGKNTDQTIDYVQKYYVSKISNKAHKPRIMFSSGQWLTGGMERVMSILFAQLKDDYEIFLLTAYDGQQGKIEMPDHVTHIKVSVSHFWSSFDHVVLTYSLAFDIDVAIGFMNLFVGQLDFYQLCEGTRVKTVASNHEIYFYPYSNPLLFDVIQKRIDAYKNVNATLWLTNFSAAAYGLVADNSYLMPNPNTYKVQSGNNGSGKIILCVARFNDYIKRVDRMLECFSLVSKSHPDAALMLVGKYDRDVPVLPDGKTTIDDLIKKFKIDDSKLNFVGEVANVEKYYAQASVLVLTSMNEGFGMVINEAASFGVPTVSNKIPGLEDLITNDKNGYLIDQDDIKGMAEAVNNILSDKKLRDRLGENAKNMVLRFDEVEIGKKWKYLINNLLEDASGLDARLNKELAYKIDDYQEFSKLLFSELNNVVAVSRTELQKSRNESVSTVISKRALNNYRLLRKSVRTKGVILTGKIVAKKTYHKTRRIYKGV